MGGSTVGCRQARNSATVRAAKHHELNVVRAASGLCVVPDDRVIRHLGGVVQRDSLVPLGHFLKQKLLEVHMLSLIHI